MSRYLKDETIRKVINSSTGEIIEETESKRYRRTVTQDDFYFSFLKTVDFESKLTRAEIIILAQLNKHSAYNTNEVSMTRRLREYIASVVGLSYQSFSNAISSLKKKGIIGTEKGVILINPHYSWKGELAKRDDFMRSINIEFEIINEDIVSGIKVKFVEQNIKKKPN